MPAWQILNHAILTYCELEGFFAALMLLATVALPNDFIALFIIRYTLKACKPSAGVTLLERQIFVLLILLAFQAVI